MTREEVKEYIIEGLMSLDTGHSVDVPDFLDFYVDKNRTYTWNNNDKEGEFWKLFDEMFEKKQDDK